MCGRERVERCVYAERFNYKVPVVNFDPDPASLNSHTRVIIREHLLPETRQRRLSAEFRLQSKPYFTTMNKQYNANRAVMNNDDDVLIRKFNKSLSMIAETQFNKI